MINNAEHFILYVVEQVEQCTYSQHVLKLQPLIEFNGSQKR